MRFYLLSVDPTARPSVTEYAGPARRDAAAVLMRQRGSGGDLYRADVGSMDDDSMLGRLVTVRTNWDQGQGWSIREELTVVGYPEVTFADSTKYALLGPDGIRDRPDDPYDTIEEFEEAIQAYVDRYRARGYYATAKGERIEVEALEAWLKMEIVAERTGVRYCDQCGGEASQNLDSVGVTHHVAPDGNIDHVKDADHVAVLDEHVGS